MTALALIADYGPSACAFALFGLLHSLGAQEPFKDWLARRTSVFFVRYFWRLIYCSLSFWAVYFGVASLHWGGNPDSNIWLVVYPDWLWEGMLVLHLVSIAVMYVAFVQSDYPQFLGFTQAWQGMRALAGLPERPLTLFGTDRLEIRGIYGWVRHPMLSAGLLFLLTSGPSLNNLIYSAMYAVYMVLGGWYEERRMIRVFGQQYQDYRRRVGAFVPALRTVRSLRHG
ncbi:MAG: methyltransferase family protein [Paracoccaceae bacterium]